MEKDAVVILCRSILDKGSNLFIIRGVAKGLTPLVTDCKLKNVLLLGWELLLVG